MGLLACARENGCQIGVYLEGLSRRRECFDKDQGSRLSVDLIDHLFGALSRPLSFSSYHLVLPYPLLGRLILFAISLQVGSLCFTFIIMSDIDDDIFHINIVMSLSLFGSGM
jgi:hypothetical protein